ncbi:MAG: hypothetical protein KatS3mg105_4580 [Gemmatales bacterium]|nr:MAG: hypothetical protein KatS3mg105_4580 [Gemmatales bacterium]
MNEPAPARVRLSRENYIPVSKHRLTRKLIEQLPDESSSRQWFGDFCRLIEAIYHFEYHRTSEELKEDFHLFNSEMGQRELDQAAPEQVAKSESRFLSHFIDMMRKANFQPLTQADVDMAEAEDYLFNLPVIIDWEKLDAEMLPRFFASHPYSLEGEPPEFAKRILIFRRGVGIDQAVGFHLLAKIDLLVTFFLEWLFSLPRRLFGKQPPAKAAPPADCEPPPKENKTSIFEEEYVERVTLRHSMTGIGALFRRTRLQEPTFRELVILFRFASLPKNGANKKDWAVHVKAFRDIPMADLEVVFPEKRISMQAIDLVKLVITGAIGFVVVLVKFVFSAALNPLVALAALSTIGGYVAKIFVGFKASKDRYQYLVTHSLYHKNLDNDLGVVFYLMDSLEEQEFKEAVLAYYMLLRKGACSEKELDAHCEEFLHEHFGVKVDFEADDALAKLERDHLVEFADSQYRAIGLEEALRRLDEKWDNYFAYNNG